jgi:peptide/nickel transport system substrate-binding protein
MLDTIEEDRLLLVRSPNFWGEPAKVEKVEVRTVRDSNARTLMLVGGSADFTQNSIRSDLVGQVSQSERVKVLSGPGAILTYMMMNNEDSVLKDVRVRRAIFHAVDRIRIIKAKFHGRAALAAGLLPTSHWAYEKDVRTYPYDPDTARRLLDEAGYPDPDGPGGEPRLRFTYKTSANQFRLALARIFASQLAEVGIEIEVRSFEFGTFFADIKKGNFQIASMQTAAITEPDYFYTYFNSERIPTVEAPNLHNRWRYRNSEFDRLTLAGRGEINVELRQKLYSSAQKILAEDLPVIPLWHEDVIAVMNVDVDGYVVLPSARFGGLTKIEKKR